MSFPLNIVSFALLLPLGAAIAYTDIRYRRISNKFVLALLCAGLLLNAAGGGLVGLRASLLGCLFAFALMLVLHIFGTTGAGDVKLFAAVGALVGYKLVLPTFAVVLIVGFVLALISMLRAGSGRTTLYNVAHFFFGLLPGARLPRFAASVDRAATIPYGVAITLGSLISLAIFRG